MALDFREPFPSRYFLFLYSQLLAHMECCQNFCGGKLKAFLSSQERRGEVGELLLGGRKVFSLPVSYLLHFLMHEFSSLLCGCLLAISLFEYFEFGSQEHEFHTWCIHGDAYSMSV